MGYLGSSNFNRAVFHVMWNDVHVVLFHYSLNAQRGTHENEICTCKMFHFVASKYQAEVASFKCAFLNLTHEGPLFSLLLDVPLYAQYSA